MKFLTCLAAVILLANSFAIQIKKDEQISQEKSFSFNKPVLVSRSALKEFKNYTGSSFGQAQLRSLINIINNASAIYTNDIQNNLKYIKINMDAAFADENSQYSVIMQVSETRDFGDAYVYCQNGTNFAFIGYEVNLKFPSWTYLVFKLYAPNTSFNYIPNAEGRGTGMTADTGVRVGLVIQSVDVMHACKCSQTKEIANILQNYLLNERWNVVCQSTLNIYSYNAILNSDWIMFKPYECAYFIYTI